MTRVTQDWTDLLRRPGTDRLDPDLSAAFAPATAAAHARLEPQLPSAVFVHSERAPMSSVGDTLRGTGKTLTPAQQGRRRKRWRPKAGELELPGTGSIIDKYRIEQLVGSGGFAVVYRATHLLLDMPVAIKLLRPKLVRRRPDLTALLCKEARFAAKISHRNVVRIYDVTHTPLITYVVMEYIEGESLARRIDHGGALSPAETLRIGLDVAAGLKAGLEQRIIHRDIKPANILLTTEAETKIVDLGLAQPNFEGDTLATPKAPRWVIGTPGYMAPEQVLDPSRVNFQADIYSLGVTLYHAAVGAPPFPLNDINRCLAMHRSDPIPPPADRVPNFPPVLSKLLLWMLAKQPAKRPGSYDALMDAMRAALAELSPTEAATTDPLHGRG